MTVHVAETSVSTSVTVEAPIERAFKIFTEDMGTWWDADHHLVDGFERLEVQLHEGGRIIDHGRDGTTCSWARVLAYEPPSRFVFSWDIALDWQIETDARRASEVEVRFTSDGPSRTRVELEHKHLDRHGDGWESMREAVGSPNGWNLAAYAASVQSTPHH
jgi:uncharacterized protein YndB with AHSA1/START domain